ncbi:MAG: transcriptional antiterminator, Rof [Gammaproteobacteria bacterium]|nr:transcriptional antiterminator, Rof [Gammaproteobacteria bacterium]
MNHIGSLQKYFRIMVHYTPVSCALHSELELAILRKSPRLLKWVLESGEVREETITPVDLITRIEGEFLLFNTAQQERLEIRLDQIY